MILPCLRFIVIYAALVTLGTGFPDLSRACLQSMAESFYSGTDDRWEVTFEPLPQPENSSLVRAVIADRSRMNRDDSGPVRNLDLNAADLIAKPLALSWALILCTPVSWPRRFAALIWCSFWEQVIVLAVVGFCIWNEGTELSLHVLPPLAQLAATALRQMIVAQLGLAVPVLLWIVVVFQRDDRRLLEASVISGA